MDDERQTQGVEALDHCHSGLRTEASILGAVRVQSCDQHRVIPERDILAF